MMPYPTHIPADAPNHPTWDAYEYEPFARATNRVYAAPPVLGGTLIDTMNPKGMHNGFSTSGPTYGHRAHSRLCTGFSHGAIDAADRLDCLAMLGDIESAMALHAPGDASTDCPAWVRDAALSEG